MDVADMEFTSIQENGDVCEEQMEEQCVEDAREENFFLNDIVDQIFQSPLPTYLPTVALVDDFNMNSCFTCEECEDKFVMKSSLDFHMERRSVLITYDCEDCGTIVTAFNRCSLLAHFRQHNSDGNYVCDPTKISVTPIPLDKMLIGPLTQIPLVENKCGIPSSSNVSVQSSDCITRVSDDLEVRSCSECGEQITETLLKHFQGPNVPIDCDLQCNDCSLILPTKCSLKAHERYHKKERPFVCPDCTKLFLTWDSFSLHLSSTCYHVEKRVRYKCPCCEVVLASYISLQAHVCEKHVKLVYKCSGCPVACFTKQALQAHKVKSHEQGALPPTKSYRQCQLCPEILLQESLLLAHVLEHIKKPALRVYGYQCNGCNNAFQKRHAFAVHKVRCFPRKRKTGQTVEPTRSNSVTGPTNKTTYVHISIPITQQSVCKNTSPTNMTTYTHTSNPSAQQSACKNSIPNTQQSVCKNTSPANKITYTCASTPSAQQSVCKNTSPTNKTTYTHANIPIVQQSMCKNSSPTNKITCNRAFIPSTQQSLYKSTSPTNKNTYTRACIPNTQQSMCKNTTEPLTLVSKSTIPLICQVVVPTIPKSSAKVANVITNKSYTVDNNIKKQIKDSRGNTISTYQITMASKKARNESYPQHETKDSLSLNGVGETNLVVKDTSSVGKKNGSRIIGQCIVCRKKLVFNIPFNDKSNLNVSLRCATCTREKSNNKNKEQGKAEHVNIRNEDYSVKNTSLLERTKTKQLPPSIVAKLKRDESNSMTLNEPSNKKFKALPSTTTTTTTNTTNTTTSTTNTTTSTTNTTTTISKTKEKFRCHICQLLIAIDWDIIKDHFAKEHKELNVVLLSPRLKRLDIDGKTELPSNVKESQPMNSHMKKNEIKPGQGASSVKDDRSTSPKSKSKKKIPRKEKQIVFSPLISGQVISPASQGNTDGKYTCSKCKLVCGDVNVFRSHIVTHNTDGSTYQCMECGMCFVVKPSFEKHLIISHHIKNVDMYIQKNVLCHEKLEKEVSPPADEVQENQCRVCHLQFEDTVQLRKHFRSHGMAFLSMNQRELKHS